MGEPIGGMTSKVNKFPRLPLPAPPQGSAAAGEGGGGCQVRSGVPCRGAKPPPPIHDAGTDGAATDAILGAPASGTAPHGVLPRRSGVIAAGRPPATEPPASAATSAGTGGATKPTIEPPGTPPTPMRAFGTAGTARMGPAMEPPGTAVQVNLCMPKALGIPGPPNAVPTKGARLANGA